MTAPRNADERIDAFLAEGLNDLPDRAFDAVRSDIHRTRQRVVIGPWREPSMITPIRLAISAAILVVAAGVAWSQLRVNPPNIGSSTPSPAPTAAASVATSAEASPERLPIENRALAPGAYAIDYASVPGSPGSGPRVQFDVPASGWWSVDGHVVEWVYQDGISYGPAFSVWNITNVATEPCTNHSPRAPEVGPSVDDLVAAFDSLPGMQSEVSDAQVDGYSGKVVELSFDRDPVTCPEGMLMWLDGQKGRKAQGNGEVDRVYILDVEGQRITFFTRVLPDSAPEHVGQLERILESIDIQP